MAEHRCRRVGALPVVAMLLSACAMYHKPFAPPPAPIVDQVDYILQADDAGKFWDASVAEAALRDIEVSATKTNTIVVVYVHGWHHNAAGDDGDLVKFADSMRRLRELLQKDVYAESRKNLTGIRDVTVYGIYLGWRGRSLPWLLDYATVWPRKAAAERVGDGDFREFMIRLNRVYDQRNAAVPPGTKGPFTGLASFGHSLGGQVLFRATQSTFEAELLAAGAADAASREVPLTLDRPLKGFGDIVVLINPAVEALQFDRVDRLGRNLKYDRRQLPLLLVLSAAGDSARSVMFPAARAANAFFRAPLRPEVRQLWGKALGSYTPQQTHTVEQDGVFPDEWTFDADRYLNDECEIVNFDLTGEPSFDSAGSKIRFVPLGRVHPYRPFLVADVPISIAEVMSGHVRIWEGVLHTFLSNYVAIAQGKRMVLRARPNIQCPQPR